MCSGCGKLNVCLSFQAATGFAVDQTQLRKVVSKPSSEVYRQFDLSPVGLPEDHSAQVANSISISNPV
jgi:hypothetical protein